MRLFLFGLFRLFLNIVHNLIVLLLDSLNCLIFIMLRNSSIGNRFLNDLIFFILPIELDFEIVLLRVNLVCQLSFLNDITDKFEVV
jgi:hypothetical protein